MREITIDGRRIADDTRAYLVAEIGHNHAGELGKAVQMVDDAIDAGADAVKFQTRKPDEVYARGTAPGAYDFESDNPQWVDRKYGAHRERLEFTPEEWRELFAVCRARGITAFSTPFDHSSAELLAMLDVPAFKIASGDATNTPLLRHVAEFGKPMIVSTGGCNIEDVDRIVETLEPTQTPFALLQCSCIYPAPSDVLNLRVVSSYRERYPHSVVGLSTHARDWTPSLAAFALGSRIIEHHFTHDREWQGTDNHFSLEPDSLRQLREAVDTVLPALGSSEKRRDPREESYTLERQKALYYQRDIKAGECVQHGDVRAMCPNDVGLTPPYELNKVVGHPLAVDVRKGWPVRRSYLA